MIDKTVSKKITSYFTSRTDTIAVYLFGSTAKGKERKNSDLDLAVLFEERLDQNQRFQTKLQITNDLEDCLKRKIDLVDLRSADLFFIHQIMRNKVLLFERDTYGRVAFEVDYRKRYFDHMPTLKQYYRQSRKRLREREA